MSESLIETKDWIEFFPFAETSSGPLGEGISQAVGMALADRMDLPAAPNAAQASKKEERFIYCLTGDGELDEGQNWEAALEAG